MKRAEPFFLLGLGITLISVFFVPINTGRNLTVKRQILYLSRSCYPFTPLYPECWLKEIYETRELSLVLAEQDVQLGLDFSHPVTVLENGHIVKEGGLKVWQMTWRYEKPISGFKSRYAWKPDLPPVTRLEKG